MPEEIELDVREQQEHVAELHEQHEQKHQQEEHQQNIWTRSISLSTALLAVIAALAALQSGTLVNEALLEQNRAVQFQAQASDRWAEYQAANLKGRISEQTLTLLENLGGTRPPTSATEKAKAEIERQNGKKEQLSEQAKELENKRSEQEAEAVHHMHSHHTFAYCVTFTQVAIALSAIAALTRRRPVWYGSIVLGLVGLGFLIVGFLGK